MTRVRFTALRSFLAGPRQRQSRDLRRNRGLECFIPFASGRHFAPEQLVDSLAKPEAQWINLVHD
jgi:hypothetical protein